MLFVEVLPPTTVEIVSAPVPPITIAEPVPVWIVSLPPMPGAVVSTIPSVIGRSPNGFVFAPAAKIAPLSPRMMFVPVPPVIVSLPAPPITIARPEPTVIMSLPPSVGVVEATRSMFVGSLFAPAQTRFSGLSSAPTHVM